MKCGRQRSDNKGGGQGRQKPQVVGEVTESSSEGSGARGQESTWAHVRACGVWQEEERGEGDADDASPASRVRRRYERMFKERQDGAGDSQSPTAGSRGDPQGPAGPAVPRTAFVGSISSVFAKHLGSVAPPPAPAPLQ